MALNINNGLEPGKIKLRKNVAIDRKSTIPKKLKIYPLFFLITHTRIRYSIVKSIVMPHSITFSRLPY